MMKRILLVMTMVVSIAGSAFALQAMAKEFEAKGEIVKVSKEDSTVTLKEMENPVADPSPGAKQSGVVREFVVNEATKLTADGDAIELEDLQAGTQATIRYVIEAGDNIAKSIDLQRKATE